MTNEEQTKAKSFFTPKKIMRVLSLLCIIFVFCPSFLVSCSGQQIDVNVMTAVGGMSVYGETVVDPHPIMLVCLLIPIAMLVLLFIKKLADQKTAIIIALCGAIDTAVWIIFRSTVKKLAEENYCTFKITAWYVLNIISLVLIIVLSALVILKKLEMDFNLVTLLSGGDMQGKLEQVTKAVNTMSNQVSEMASSVASNVSNKKSKENYIGYCSKCGSGIVYGNKFCTSCGNPVPQSMLDEAEEKKRLAEEQAAKEAEEKRLAEEQAAKELEGEKAEEVTINNEKSNAPSSYCKHCGAKLGPNSVFCENCGTKAE